MARRPQHLAVAAQTPLEFEPVNYQQSAGLVLYYHRHKSHYLEVIHDEEQGRVLNILCCPGDWPESRLNMPLPIPIGIDTSGAVSLRCEVEGAALRFSWRLGSLAEGNGKPNSGASSDDGVDSNDQGWHRIGPTLDASIVSDEVGRREHANFTGAFVGMVAFDTSGGGRAADFGRFDYYPRVK